MSNLVYEALMNLMPGSRKRTASGWVNIDGVCCIHNGESRDTRKRLGITMGLDNASVVVQCFNCKFRAGWKPGQNLSKRMTSFLQWMGMGDAELKKLSFKIWQEREREKMDPTYVPKEYAKLDFKPAELPKGAKHVLTLLEEGCEDPNFLKTMLYLSERGDDILTGYDFYWTPIKAEYHMNERIIVPFRWKGEIVGWTARAVFPTKHRYTTSVQPNYLFNTEVADGDWEYLFLCEGPFDAIAINGVATLGDKITDDQIRWLNQCGKTIVVVPDRVDQGGTLVDVAIKEGWHVSFPRWDAGIKDGADACKTYGKLYTIWSIIDAKAVDKLEINVRRQRLR